MKNRINFRLIAYLVVLAILLSMSVYTAFSWYNRTKNSDTQGYLHTYDQSATVNGKGGTAQTYAGVNNNGSITYSSTPVSGEITAAEDGVNYFKTVITGDSSTSSVVSLYAEGIKLNSTLATDFHIGLVEQEKTYKTPIKGTGIYVPGSYNNWAADPEVEFVTTTSPDIITATVEIASGSYEFKINDTNTGSWYGNTGTITDTTAVDGNSGWVMSTSQNNCTLKATGGTYTFNFDKSTNKLVVLYGDSRPSNLFCVEDNIAVAAGGSVEIYWFVKFDSPASGDTIELGDITVICN